MNKIEEYKSLLLLKHGSVETILDEISDNTIKLSDCEKDEITAMEEMFAESGMHSLEYAKITNNRFIAGEPSIAKIHTVSLFYSELMSFLWKSKRQPRPNENDPLLQNPNAAYVYIKIFIKKRYKKFEPVILADKTTAYQYAKRIIKGRWPEAEPFFAESPIISSLYARKVLNGRFELGEKSIKHDFKLWDEYKTLFLNDV